MSDPAGPGSGRRALVITASDGVAAGIREDRSGVEVARRLAELGFAVERAVEPDDADRLAAAIRQGAATHALVVTTGGTGLTPRDVTPQATRSILDYEIPGIGELMRAEGRRSTPMAALGRGTAGAIGGSLVVNLPGSPRGALESLDAIAAILGHALDTLAGPFDHDERSSG